MRTGHPFHMHDAIYAQPGALRLVGRGNEARIAEAAARVREAPHVVVTGIGSSWHAALVGAQMLARVGRLGPRVRPVHAFELVEYGPSVGAGDGVILVSHRGGSRSARRALESAKAGGGFGVTVTGKGSEGL